MKDKGARVKRACIWYPVCPIKHFTDAGKLDQKWVEGYCLVANPGCVRFQMESQGKPHPDHMLPDGSLDSSLI